MYHIKNDKRSIQSSQWIYNALEELMQTKNFNEITVTELVDIAKVGRTTFYRSFDSIEDVLRMKCEEKFEELYKFLLEYYKSNNQKLEPPFLKPFLRFWYINSNIIELLIKANKMEIIKSSFINIVALFKDNLINPKFYNFNNQNYFIEIRYSIAISIFTEWIKNDKNIAPDDLASSLVEQFKIYADLNLLL